MTPAVLRSSFSRTVGEGRFIMRSTVTAKILCGCGCGNFAKKLYVAEVGAALLGSRWRVTSGQFEARQRTSAIDELAATALATVVYEAMKASLPITRQSFASLATSILRSDGSSVTSVFMLDVPEATSLIPAVSDAVYRQALDLAGVERRDPFPANLAGRYSFPEEPLFRAPILKDGALLIDCLLCYQDGKVYVEDLTSRVRVCADEADVIRVGIARMKSKNVIAAAEWMKTFGAAALEGVDVGCY